MITLYRTDGTEEQIEQKTLTREWIREQIDGPLEIIQLTTEESILCNADGKPMKLRLAHREIQNRYREFGGDICLVGNCIIVSWPDLIP